MSFLSPDFENEVNLKRNSFSGLPVEKHCIPETRSCDILFPPTANFPSQINRHSASNLCSDAPKSKCSSMLKMPSVTQLLKLTLSPSTSSTNGWQTSQVVVNGYPVIVLSPECDMECRLCLNTVAHSQFHFIAECDCSFCKQCLKQYLTLNIKEANVSLPCPNHDCSRNGYLSTKEIKDLVEPEVFELYQKYKLNREVSLDEERVWCPKIGCESVCYIKNGEPVQCNMCHFKFCPKCKALWHPGSCDQLIYQDIIFENEDIKSCPSCKVLIERNDGCAQMMCKYCEHIFCWHCLASLDEDVFLKHFDKGPCKNKLGHSKASLMWHRARVAAFMAGLGLLILAVSPLLILAAPCLLCRCKQIRTMLQEENTPPAEDL